MVELREIHGLNMESSNVIAKKIISDFKGKKGVFSEFSFPPEFDLPEKMDKGSEEHLAYQTLTLSLNYMRDAQKLYKQSHDAWLSSENKWIFYPDEVMEKGIEKLTKLFNQIKDQRPNQDSRIWFTICKTIHERFEGSIRKMFKILEEDAIKISDYVEQNKKNFPYLAGNKIKPLWLRVINDTAGIRLNRIKDIPIPVDVHTARLSLKILFNESFKGVVTNDTRIKVQEGWKQVLESEEFYPLQLDEPLWILGKYKLFDKFMRKGKAIEE
ncbi:MAG: N-glycosylase/DNA lyase [Candidatus Nanoarchaeia archaeon]